MKHLALTCLLALFAVSSVDAQRLAAEFSSGILPSSPVTLRVYDTTGNGFNLSSPCGNIDVFYGSQTGTPVPDLWSCGPGLTIVPPFGVYTFAFSPLTFGGTLLPSGDYHFRFRAIDPVTSAPIEPWLVYRLGNQGTTLNIGGEVRVGLSTPVSVFNGPPGGVYWIGASRTSNAPLTAYGQPLALSYDGLFNVMLVQPQSLFSSHVGMLDGNGFVTTTLSIPPLVNLAYGGFVLQALTIDTVAVPPMFGTSNPTYGRILP